MNRVHEHLSRHEAKRRDPEKLARLIYEDDYVSEMNAHHLKGMQDARGEMQRVVMLALAGGFAAGLIVGWNW